jgi:hypothetical protein
MIETQLCMSRYDCNSNSAQNSHSALMASEMENTSSVMQVQMRFRRPDTIKSNSGFISQIVSGMLWKFSFVSKQSGSPNFFQQRRTSARLAVTGVTIVKFFKLQDGEKMQRFSTQERAG